MGKKLKENEDLSPPAHLLDEEDLAPPAHLTEEETKEPPKELGQSKGFFNTLRDIYHAIKNSAQPESAEPTPGGIEDVPKPIANAFQRGAKSAEQAEILNPTGINKGGAEKVATLQKEIEKYPASKSYQDFTNASSTLDAAKAFTKDPLKILTELTVESMTSMASYGASRIGAGAALGAAAGSVIPGVGTAAGAGGGVIAGMADTSLALEFSGSILESLEKAGVDVKNPKEVQKAFENDALMDSARAHAYKKAIPISLFDLVSGGVAGKVVTKPAKSLIGKGLAGAAEFGVQAGLGMAGEASGEAISGEKLSPGAILAEGLGEFGTTPVEVSAGILSRKTSAPVSEKTKIADEIINRTADTGDNTLNAQIDADAIINTPNNESKTRNGETIRSGIGENPEEGRTQQEVRERNNGSGGEGSPRKVTNDQVGESRKETLNSENNAVQEPSASSVLQHPQETAASPGSERSGVESSQQGQETTQASNPEEKVTHKTYQAQKAKVFQLLADINIASETGKSFDAAKIDEWKAENEKLREMENTLDRQKVAREEKAAKSEEVNVADLLKEQIKSHYKNIETGVKKGREIVTNLLNKVTEISKEHNLTSAQVNTLINAVKRTNPFTPVYSSKLNDLIEKVTKDADYADELEKAENVRQKIRKKAKTGSSFAINKLAKTFAKIDPSTVGKKLGLYTAVADDLYNHFRNPGNVAYAPVNEKKVQEFIDTINKEQRADKIQEVRQQFGFGKEVTDADIESYLDNEDNEEEEPFATNRTATSENIIHDKIKKVAEYSKLGLEQAQFKDQTHNDKIKSIVGMDLDRMNNSQLVDYIRTVDNMVENEDFSNTDKLEARAKALESAMQLEKLLKGESLHIIGGIKQAIYSLPQIFKAAFKSSELAAEAYRLSGLGDYYNSTARVESQENTQFDEFKKKFNQLRNKDKNFDNAKTQVDAAVFGNLVRYPRGADPVITLGQSKRNIEVSIARLDKAGDKEIAADAQAAFDKFKNAQSIDEVFKIMKQSSPAAFEMWQFWKDTFQDKINNRLKKVAGEFHNEDFQEEENYTPKKFVLTDSSISSPEESATKRNTKAIGKRKQSVTAKSASNNLLSTQAINFNFYKNMFQAFRESLYDIETTRAQQVLHEFMKLPESQDLLGGKENKDTVISNWMKSEEVATSYGYQNGAGFFEELMGALRTLSYTRALGGFTEFPKQYFSVAVSTLGNLGSDFELFFTTKIPKETEQLFNMYTIGQRAKRLGGTATGETVQYKIQSAYANKALKALGKFTNFSERGSHAFMKSLSAGDVSVAKRSWVAYYMQSLRKSGVDLSTVDLTTEHNLQNQPERKKAAAYAEQKVKETQLSSNPDESAKALKTAHGFATIAKNILLPFSSFSINTKVRLTEGLNRILLQPNKWEAYRELGTAAAEIATFNALKIYIIQAGLNAYLKPLIESMFDLKGEKKKEKEEAAFKFKQWYSECIKEALPTTIGTGGTAASVYLLNWIAWGVEHPKASFEEWQKQKKEWIYNYHKHNTIDLGLYSVGLESSKTLFDNSLMSYDIIQGNKIHTSTDWGPARLSLSRGQKQMVIATTIADALSYIGWMDSDVLNTIHKVEREQIKKGKQSADRKGLPDK